MSREGKGFPWLGYGGLLLLIMLLGIGPAIMLGIVNALDPANPLDLTGLMASWGVLGWLVLAPTALAGMLFMLWIVALPIHYFVWMRGRAGAVEKP